MKFQSAISASHLSTSAATWKTNATAASQFQSAISASAFSTIQDVYNTPIGVKFQSAISASHLSTALFRFSNQNRKTFQSAISASHLSTLHRDVRNAWLGRVSIRHQRVSPLNVRGNNEKSRQFLFQSAISASPFSTKPFLSEPCCYCASFNPPSARLTSQHNKRCFHGHPYSVSIRYQRVSPLNSSSGFGARSPTLSFNPLSARLTSQLSLRRLSGY